MNRFGFSDSVLDSVKAVLRGNKPEVEVEEKSEDLLEAMEMHLKPHGTAGTHYKVHAVGKKLASHGGIRVGERLSDTEVDDARDSGIRVKHVKEGNEEEVDEGAMKRMATQAAERERLGPAKVKGSGLEGFKKKKDENVTEKKLDPVDHKALKGSHDQRKDKDIDNDGDVDSSDSYLHNRRKTVKKAINKEAHEMQVKKMGKDAMGAEKVEMSQGCPTVAEGMGDEKVRSSAQAAQLAKHYYMKAKQAQQSGSGDTASKMMSAAKKFYRASEKDSSQEKGGKQVAAAESSEEVGIGQFYFNELEIQEIEAAEDVNLDEARKGGGARVGETERSGIRVSKTSKEGPEHIAMQLRKVGSMGNRHPGVQFKDGKSAKVDTNHARSALSRYNSAKPAEKEEIQKHLAHSHDALKHVAKGGDLKSSPGASKPSKGIAGMDMTQMKRHGVQSTSGHYN